MTEPITYFYWGPGHYMGIPATNLTAEEGALYGGDAVLCADGIYGPTPTRPAPKPAPKPARKQRVRKPVAVPAKPAPRARRATPAPPTLDPPAPGSKAPAHIAPSPVADAPALETF